MRAVVLLALFATSAKAQQEVTFPSGDGQARGFFYLPQGPGPQPAAVVIQEWWGVNDRIKEQAASLAAHGYVALAVDLYRGKVANHSDMAHELIGGLPQDQGVRDRVSGVNFLQGP